MEIKYGILNPTTSQYEYVDTENEIIDKISDVAMQFYLQHTHYSPVSKVTVNEDNSETWENFNL